MAAGASARLDFAIPTRQFAFTDAEGYRIVEPGAIEVSLRRSANEVVATVAAELVGDIHRVDAADPRIAAVTIRR